MRNETNPDSELFFWIKGGREEKRESIHSIQINKPKVEPTKAAIKKPEKMLDSSRAGLKPGWTRASFIVREDNLTKIKALAYWERVNIKHVLDEALSTYLAGKDIKPLPDDLGEQK